MKPGLKKNLARKIIQKISKLQVSKKCSLADDMSSHNYSEVKHTASTKYESIQSISGVSTFLNPSQSQQTTIASKKSSSSNESRERVFKEFLQPMTHSEIDYQNHQTFQNPKNIVKPNMIKPLDNKDKSASISTVSKQNLPLLNFVRKEKQSQLNWIEKEILHLNNLRDLLANNVDSSSNTTIRSEVAQTTAFGSKSSASNNNKNKDSTKSKSGYSTNTRNEVSKISRNNPNVEIHQSQQTESSSQTNTSNKDTSNERPTKETKVSRFYNDWDSHSNLKKIIKNRSKLKTPSESDESLVSFINKRKEKFLENYEKNKKPETQDDEALYTKPYSSRGAGDIDHYSEPNEKRNMQRHKRFSKNSAIINASSSLASSEVFVSSQSISVPVVNSTNNTTTHLYDFHSN